MSKHKVRLLAVVLVVFGCAGVKTLVGKALVAGEHIVENTEEFFARRGHQQAAFNAAKIALAANGGRISAVDVIGLCTPSGCHAIKI